MTRKLSNYADAEWMKDCMESEENKKKPTMKKQNGLKRHEFFIVSMKENG
jgi:hypothetical protein